jgi:hypothetical protein
VWPVITKRGHGLLQKYYEKWGCIYREGEGMSRVAVLSPVSETVSFVLFFFPQYDISEAAGRKTLFDSLIRTGSLLFLTDGIAPIPYGRDRSYSLRTGSLLFLTDGIAPISLKAREVTRF